MSSKAFDRCLPVLTRRTVTRPPSPRATPSGLTRISPSAHPNEIGDAGANTPRLRLSMRKAAERSADAPVVFRVTMLRRSLGAPRLLEARRQLVDGWTRRLVLALQPLEHI